MRKTPAKMASERKEEKESKSEAVIRNGYVKVYENKSLSYQQFVLDHLLPNQPLIIKNVGFNNGTDDNWCIYDKWIKKSDNGDSINYEYLSNQYGNKTIDVAYCGNKSYSDQKRESMKLKDYLKYLQDDKKNHRLLKKWLNDIKKYKLSSFNPSWTDSILYCKDWHIVCELDEEYYQTPSHFVDDWLNFYWENRGDNDYKFCYLGPKFSWTPLHHDVYLSYSWSTNIIGKKLWIMFNPNESKYYLKNAKRNEWIYNLLSLVNNNNDYINKSEYPNIDQLFEENNKILTSKMVIQNENEAIFIPSGWFHEVYNLSDIVLSINHNWFNGINIDIIWNFIHNEYKNVCQSIEDLKDIMDSNAFYQQCQQLLMDISGIDFDQFIQIISINTHNILNIICNNDNMENKDNFKMKTYLFSMKNMLNTIEQCIESKCMNEILIQKLNDIKQSINKSLSELKFIQIDEGEFEKCRV